MLCENERSRDILLVNGAFAKQHGTQISDTINWLELNITSAYNCILWVWFIEECYSEQSLFILS